MTRRRASWSAHSSPPTRAACSSLRASRSAPTATCTSPAPTRSSTSTGTRSRGLAARSTRCSASTARRASSSTRSSRPDMPDLLQQAMGLTFGPDRRPVRRQLQWQRQGPPLQRATGGLPGRLRRRPGGRAERADQHRVRQERLPLRRQHQRRDRDRPDQPSRLGPPLLARDRELRQGVHPARARTAWTARRRWSSGPTATCSSPAAPCRTRSSRRRRSRTTRARNRRSWNSTGPPARPSARSSPAAWASCRGPRAWRSTRPAT